MIRRGQWRQRWLVPTLSVTCLLTAAPVQSGEAAPVRAIFARVEGQVTIQEATSAGGAGKGILRRAARFMIVGPGDRIHVPAEGSAGLVCSTDRWIDLPGNSDQILTEASCHEGRRVADGDFATLADFEGDARSYRGAMILKRSPRSYGSAERTPQLLTPRNTAVMESRPLLVWTRVPDAASYRVWVTGGVAWQQIVDADRCGADPSTCTLAWPESAALPHDSAVTVRITVPGKQGLDGGDATPWLLRLAEQAERDVQDAIAVISSLALRDDQRALMTADLLGSKGLHSAEISLLSAAARRSDAAEIRLALGKAFLMVELTELAEQSFLAAAANRDPEIVAGIDFGLGQIAWARGDLEVARSQLREASEGFARNGMLEEAEAARKLVARIRLREP